MLTTLAKVKARLGIKEEDVIDDDMLTNLIAMVSARFDTICNRSFGYATNAIEEFEGDATEIAVRCFPIDESRSLTFEFRETAALGWQTPSSADYIVRKSCIISLFNKLTSWRSQARVTYSGGYKLPDGTSPAEAIVDLPSDVELSAVEQIAYWYQNRNRLGLTGISADGGSIQQFATLDLLPNVKNALRQHERWIC